MERKKIDEMKLPEKLTYTLPTSDAFSMNISAKLLSGSFETLLATEQLKVNLSWVSNVSTITELAIHSARRSFGQSMVR